MTEQQLMEQLRTLNESELFYRSYRLARSSPEGFGAYLARLDPEDWDLIERMIEKVSGDEEKPAP